MSEFNRIVVKGVPETVEIDPSCHSAYIRFKKAKIDKTIGHQHGHTMVAVDLDRNGEVIGVELVGVREISIEALRNHLPSRMREVNFEKARFMPVTDAPFHRGMQPA